CVLLPMSSWARYCLSACEYHRVVPSFPTRRSSDLERACVEPGRVLDRPGVPDGNRRDGYRAAGHRPFGHDRRAHREHDLWIPRRSEEHTSELQSRENLVCRLLLEKKKKTKHIGYYV